jgi:hypothetical protein
MVFKFPDADGLACMAGSLTVIDIDARGAEGERLLADVQREVGESRFIVRTGGGGFHAYFRHRGEGRKIRLDPRRPIDLLGGGQIVLPPSTGSKAKYEIIHGTLDDLTALTPIRSAEPALGAVCEHEQPAPAAFANMQANTGRNNTLFDSLCKEARSLPPTLQAFIDRGRELNQLFGEPMTDSRVINTAKSVFRYVEKGELRTGEHGAWFQRPQVQALAREPYLFALIGWLKAQNGPEAEFWIANGLAAAHLGWPTDQLREARNRAKELGWIEMIAQAAKGRNALYRWGPTAKTSHGFLGVGI